MNWDPIFAAILQKNEALVFENLKNLPKDWRVEGIPHDKFGSSPLFLAIKQGLESTVAELLKIGFHPADTNRDCKIAISALLDHKSQSIFQSCLHTLINTNSNMSPLPKDSKGETLLHKMIDAKEEDWCINLLNFVEPGEWNSLNSQGESPYTLSVTHGLLDFISEFIFQCPIALNWTNSRSQNAIHISTINNHLDLLKYLWIHCTEKSNELIRNLDQDGNTCIHLACEYDSVESLEFLLEYDIDAFVLNNKNETAIVIAERNANRHAIKILKKHIINKLLLMKESFPDRFIEKLSIVKREGFLNSNDFYQLEL